MVISNLTYLDTQQIAAEVACLYVSFMFGKGDPVLIRRDTRKGGWMNLHLVVLVISQGMVTSSLKKSSNLFAYTV